MEGGRGEGKKEGRGGRGRGREGGWLGRKELAINTTHNWVLILTATDTR